MAATSAGLGWIGKNGLLINREFGPRLSLVTVLTDAAIDTDMPVEHCCAGSASLREVLSFQAITGSSGPGLRPSSNW